MYAASVRFASGDDIDHTLVPNMHERSEWIRKIKRATSDTAGKHDGTLVSGVFLTVSGSSYTHVYNKMLIQSVNAWLDPSACTVAYVTTSGVPIHRAHLHMGTVANAGVGMYAPTWKRASRGCVVPFRTSFVGLPVENVAAIALYNKTVGCGHTMGVRYDPMFQKLETMLYENASRYTLDPSSVQNPSWLSTDDTRLFAAYQHAPLIPKCDVDVYDIQSAVLTSKQMTELVELETKRINALSKLYMAVNTHKSKIALGHSSESHAAQRLKLERLCMQEAIEKANGGVLLAKRHVQASLTKAEMLIQRKNDKKSKTMHSNRRKGQPDSKEVSDSTMNKMLTQMLDIPTSTNLSLCDCLQRRLVEPFYVLLNQTLSHVMAALASSIVEIATAMKKRPKSRADGRRCRN